MGTGRGPTHRRVAHQPLQFNSATLRGPLDTLVTIDKGYSPFYDFLGVSDRVVSIWIYPKAPE